MEIGRTAKPTPLTEAAARPVPKRGPGAALERVPDVVWTLLIAIGAVTLLEMSARNQWISPFLVPSPSSVWNALVDGFSRGLYQPEIASTLISALTGFLLAFAISIAIAGILVSSEKLESIFYPFIVAFQSLPKVAIAPLIIIWIGFGDTSKVVIVAIICFFPMLVNNLQGLKIRDRHHFELFKSLGANHLQTFRYLRAPAALPFIFAGLKISTVFALIGAIVAEFLGSQSGIGRLLLFEKSVFNIPGVFAVLVILMIMGILINVTMGWLERRLMFWAKNINIAA